jgi:aspartate/methionine/tyrosine aminotransferase
MIAAMASYLDQVPFSGIIRIRDMMYSVDRPFRLDQGDVSFDAPESVKTALLQGIHDNRTHYVQTTGIPQLLELLATKLRDRNHIPVERHPWRLCGVPGAARARR